MFPTNTGLHQIFLLLSEAVPSGQISQKHGQKEQQQKNPVSKHFRYNSLIICRWDALFAINGLS